jgi:hypothetical protein
VIWTSFVSGIFSVDVAGTLKNPNEEKNNGDNWISLQSIAIVQSS